MMWDGFERYSYVHFWCRADLPRGVPNSPAYQQKCAAQKETGRVEEHGDKKLFHQLDARSQKRFLVLKHITKEVRGNFENLPYSSQPMLESISEKDGRAAGDLSDTAGYEPAVSDLYEL
jgi:hypothetical protein